jgi:hypothetical protein
MTIREIIDNSEVWYTYSAGDMEYVRTTEADKDIDCRLIRILTAVLLQAINTGQQIPQAMSFSVSR